MPLHDDMKLTLFTTQIMHLKRHAGSRLVSPKRAQRLMKEYQLLFFPCSTKEITPDMSNELLELIQSQTPAEILAYIDSKLKE